MKNTPWSFGTIGPRRFIFRLGRWEEIPYWPKPSEPNPAWHSPASAAKAPGGPRLALAILGAIAFFQALAIFYLLETR